MTTLMTSPAQHRRFTMTTSTMPHGGSFIVTREPARTATLASASPGRGIGCSRATLPDAFAFALNELAEL